MIKQFKEKMHTENMDDVYEVTMKQTLDLFALTDEGFRNVLAREVMYSIKPDDELKAVAAHADYLLYVKRNSIKIENCLKQVLTRMGI